jgi:hypothetical protein
VAAERRLYDPSQRRLVHPGPAERFEIIAAVFSGLRSRRGLVLENMALRQQLSTVLQKRRPLIGPAFVLRRLWSR